MTGDRVFLNAAIFTGDHERLFLKNGYLRIFGDSISALGPMPQYTPRAGEQVTDLHGRIVTPGNISTHYHFYGQFARGIPIAGGMGNWQQVLSHLWWEMDRAMDEEALYYAAMMGLVEGLKCGTTTYFDHNATPGCIDGSLDVIRKAVKQAGARAALAYEVTDRNGKEGARAGIRENERMIRACRREDDPLIRALFGLHASYTLDDDTLERCQSVQQSLGAGYHIHMAEAEADVSDCYKRFDMHVVERLHAWGILNERTITAHNVHVGPEQWEIMRRTGVTAAHNVQSNTNNAVGICPVCQLLAHGVHVALGGDGYAPDLFTELSMIPMLQHLAGHTPAACTQAQLLALAYENPRRLIKNTFGYDCGMLRAGDKADLVILSYDPPTPVLEQNVVSHVLCGGPGHVDTVFIAGREVVKGGRCTALDEAEINAKCREAAGRLWARLP